MERSRPRAPALGVTTRFGRLLSTFRRPGPCPADWRGLYVSEVPMGGAPRAWSVPATGEWISSEPF